MPLNEGYDYQEYLGKAAAGQPLLVYLSNRYRHSTAAQWAARIRAGGVLIDDQPAQVDSVLQSGSELRWRRPPWIEPDAPRNFSVLYEDADLLVVNKPAGLPTLPGANFLQATLLYQVRRYAADAAPVHRLGRWTSGIVVCARHPRARAELMRQWSAQTVIKRYRALLSGVPRWEVKTVTTPIGPVPHDLLGTVHAATATGKSAFSQFTVLERRAAACLCEVQITTGRPHQIRIHAAALGHPLLGDPLYIIGGLPAPASHALPGDPGYLLHAAEVRLRHPCTGLGLTLECAAPAALRRSRETPHAPRLNPPR
ncbi:MAG: RluA family pseudouridine synthase [Gammaproteobacteria bacterium]|nr:RluA family pseudouridine synthase [Gammaproteobacteria bacterium]